MVMMLGLMFSVLVFGAPPIPAIGEFIAVPEHGYERIESASALPKTYLEEGWTEGHYGNWLEASQAQGAESVQTIVSRLGPPLEIPSWDGSTREAYLFSSRETVEAGLIIEVDRDRQLVVLRRYTSAKLSFGARPHPPGLEWEAMLMTWFRWLTTPDEKLPSHIRTTGKTHPFTLKVNGEHWIMPGMHLPMIAGLAMALDGRTDVPRPGGKIVVPDQFYAPISDVSELPSGWRDPSWKELPHPAPVKPRAEGSEAVKAALMNLGPPLELPPTGSGERAREGWVFILKAHSEAGLLAVLDREAEVVELRGFYSDKLPAHVPATPMGDWWPQLLAKWWQAQVDPAFEMPANGRFVDRPASGR